MEDVSARFGDRDGAVCVCVGGGGGGDGTGVCSVVNYGYASNVLIIIPLTVTLPSESYIFTSALSIVGQKLDSACWGGGGGGGGEEGKGGGELMHPISSL